MLPVFRSIKVWPSYGINEAFIEWTFENDPGGTQFHVYRSADGAGEWKRTNTGPVLQPYYTDRGFDLNSRTKTPHFRILAVLSDGSTVDSPVVGLFDTLAPHEYGPVTMMVRREYMNARTGGFDVFLLKEKTSGQVAPNFEEETSTPQASCPATDDPAEDGFGRKYQGGFRPPWHTVILPMDTGPIVKLDREDGMGVLDQNKMMVRMLPYPAPEKGDLFVHLPADNRWVVTDVVKPYMFRGIFPVAYDTQVELLPREAPEYRLVINPEARGNPSP